jgi:hypothetical protein
LLLVLCVVNSKRFSCSLTNSSSKSNTSSIPNVLCSYSTRKTYKESLPLSTDLVLPDIYPNVENSRPLRYQVPEFPDAFANGSLDGQFNGYPFGNTM